MSINFGLWVKSRLSSVFVNKVLLEHGHTLSFQAVYSSFQASYKVTATESSSCNRDLRLSETETLLSGLSQKKFADS